MMKFLKDYWAHIAIVVVILVAAKLLVDLQEKKNKLEQRLIELDKY
ncbi:hypothetical protein ABGT15_04405 [Flavobacterium enshiense]